MQRHEERTIAMFAVASLFLQHFVEVGTEAITYAFEVCSVFALQHAYHRETPTTGQNTYERMLNV